MNTQVFLEVTEEMLKDAEDVQNCYGDESYRLHLAHSTLKAMIDQGIINSDHSE